MVLAVGAGIAVSLSPEGWLLVIAPMTAIALLVSPAVRLSFVGVAGIAVLGPPELNVAKLMYLGGVCLSFAAALQTLLREWATLPRELARLVVLSCAAMVLLGLVAAFRLASGTDAALVLRDLTPYSLFAIGPILAIDAAARLSLDRLKAIATVGLALGSTGFLLSWIVRRGITADVGLATIFGGFFMPVSLLILATVCLASGKSAQRTIWVLLAGLAASAALVTGTRSFFLAIPALLIAVVLATPASGSRILRVAGAAAAVVTAGGLIGVLLTFGLSLNVGAVLDRWSILLPALADPTGDASLAERIAQTGTAWELFLSSPVFGIGTGLGAASAAAGAPYSSDTPLALFASLGLVGFLAVIASLGGWLGTVVTRPTTLVWPRATMIGALTAAVTFSFIGAIPTDKGVGFTFLLLGAPLAWTFLAVDSTGHEAHA
jgi:hypothetical protein